MYFPHCLLTGSSGLEIEGRLCTAGRAPQVILNEIGLGELARALAADGIYIHIYMYICAEKQSECSTKRALKPRN
jgi:hypothetical protein